MTNKMNFNLSKSKILLLCCLAFIIGIAIASFLPENILRHELWWFGGVIGGGVIVALFWRIEVLRLTALVALFLFLAIWRYGVGLSENTPDKIWHYNGQEVKVVGVIANEPDVREDKMKLEIESEKLKVGRGYKDVYGKILVTTNLYPAYQYGDELEIKCKLEKPEQIRDFAYDRYLARYDIYSVCYWPEIRLLASGKSNKFYQNIFIFKNKLREIIDAGLPEPESNLAGPLILGGQKGMGEKLRQKFSQTGLSHITAVSGMNVSMLAVMVAFLLYGAGLRRSCVFYASTAFLIVYVILVGAPASAMRAGLMGFLVLWALHLGRLNKLTNSLALAAAILLLINPKLLRDDIGFQLSFLAIAGLIYLYPLLDERLQKIKIPKLAGLRDIFSATLAAQIFTLPIIALNFSQVSAIAPIANLVVLWTLPFVTAAIIAALLLGFLFLAFSFLFFAPSLIFLKYIIFAVEQLSKVPYAYFQVDYLSKWWIALYYLCMGWFIFLKSKKEEKSVNHYNG
ncbi:ComEC/Rec2 family competence protein [Candidatus Falkowbacteria bacterium]|nr:ComEC/Rec2 family competence protein [Candidatus Falkowbacteria bacterium]